MDAFGPLNLLDGFFPHFSGLAGDRMFERLGQERDSINHLLEHSLYGADLWRFDNGFSPARPENVIGVGNYLNYGIRTMISDSKHLYVGTANPMNLKTGDGKKGGWELRILTGGSGSRWGEAETSAGMTIGPHLR